MGRNPVEMKGRRFGRLLVLERADRLPYYADRHTRWLCRCDCGQEIAINGFSLRGGRTMSCGCLRREKTAERRRRQGQ